MIKTVIKLFVSYVPEIATLSGKPSRSNASYTVFIMCIFVNIRTHVWFLHFIGLHMNVSFIGEPQLAFALGICLGTDTAAAPIRL